MGHIRMVEAKLRKPQALAGVDANTADDPALRSFRAFYEADPNWAVEVDSFQFLLAGDLGDRPDSEIDSSGYVVHTLTASLWCLLTTSGFEECVLRAVNLGGDPDTTGCVARRKALERGPAWLQWPGWFVIAVPTPPGRI